MESIWKASAEMPRFPALDRDIKTDVLIIGGGIAGILTAFFLGQKGVDYVLVEKEKICSGITGNTTAKITFQHGLIYNKILKTSGAGAAKQYLLANCAAFDKYAELCESIDCDYTVSDNYVYSTGDRQILEEEISALNKIGYSAVLCEKADIPIKNVGAVMFPRQAQFNPLKFLAAIAKDLKIYENTFVREMVGTTAVTDKYKIRADKVIVATHFPFINKHGLYFLKMYQHRSYVIALENAGRVDGMYVDNDSGGMSLRNYGSYLFVGGSGHRTGKNGCGWEALRKFARQTFPQAKEVYHWAAQDCMSLDKIPYIGHYSKHTPNLFTATGFNKWGMTLAMVSAMILSETVLGRRSEYAQVFDPSRSILKPQLLVNGFESTKNLLTPTSKRCPHLGCALKWNKAEHTWDCPCHGSRFSSQGKVLDNPANGDLKGAGR
ncbi:MAG: FAD-dependent oxidoreductase [Clostridia bacterium]|nr:FAD-dependent oxidoreductase [Clostridia bacterium]